jgi:hypothetical protein
MPFIPAAASCGVFRFKINLRTTIGGEIVEIKLAKLWPLLVIFAIVIVVFFGPVYTIDATERGVLLTWGKVSEKSIDP